VVNDTRRTCSCLEFDICIRSVYRSCHGDDSNIRSITKLDSSSTSDLWWRRRNLFLLNTQSPNRGANLATLACTTLVLSIQGVLCSPTYRWPKLNIPTPDESWDVSISNSLDLFYWLLEEVKNRLAQPSPPAGQKWVQRISYWLQMRYVQCKEELTMLCNRTL